MNGKELIKIFKKNGWKLNRITGSHHMMVKDSKTVSIPVHSAKDIGIGLVKAILKQGKIKL